ncbi:LDB19-like protein [Chlorella sorokiniana]|uniref:LDB19-like protein n=1 Tax=Chlorella sorokiniana TaxID=3076 RepID=A0A2P6TXC7_CHLSO|nr:LDB19-like protein [Chlorella sorokiniana]|eukprot:PRW58716.1 LDB19-like protein [Chlorella sorokiniana]
MRMPLCLLLVVCALAVGAVPSRADEGFCPMGTADNWLPLSTETEVPQLVQDSLAEEVSLLLERVADDANSTWVPCSNATVTIEGCLQSVAGTNYWLRLNVSCPAYDFPDTLQLEATVYDPLDNTTRPTIGLSVLEQPEGPPDGFDELASAPQDWVAIPDDAALFQELPYEREGLVAAGPAGPAGAAGEAPAPAPAEDDGGSEEELPAEAEVDPAVQGDGTDAEQQAVEQQLQQ